MATPKVVSPTGLCDKCFSPVNPAATVCPTCRSDLTASKRWSIESWTKLLGAATALITVSALSYDKWESLYNTLTHSDGAVIDIGVYSSRMILATSSDQRSDANDVGFEARVTNRGLSDGILGDSFRCRLGADRIVTLAFGGPTVIKPGSVTVVVLMGSAEVDRPDDPQHTLAGFHSVFDDLAPGDCYYEWSDKYYALSQTLARHLLF